MRHIAENGHCTIYHTRSFTPSVNIKSRAYEIQHVTRVHVLLVLIHMNGRRRKNNFVRVRVQLWPTHTPYVEVIKVEEVQAIDMNQGVVLVTAGKYLQDWMMKFIYPNVLNK